MREKNLMQAVPIEMHWLFAFFKLVVVGILSDDFKTAYPEMPWKDIKQMHNIVAHKYGSFDFDVLWEVVE